MRPLTASAILFLIATPTFASERLIPRGVGPLAPRASNDSDAGRAENRPVELVKRPSAERRPTCSPWEPGRILSGALSPRSWTP